MTTNTRFSPEVRQRAIRMVLKSQNEYDSQWAALSSIAPKIGCTPETLVSVNLLPYVAIKPVLVT